MADPVTIAALTATASQIGSFVAANAATISAVTAAAGGGLAAAGTIAAGNAAVDAAKQEQKQLNQMAAEERAVASRQKAAVDLRTRQLISRGQAVAAASGAGATDPTVMQIMGGIVEEGEVQKAEAMRQGTEAGKGLEYKGRVGVAGAKASRGLGYMTAGGQVLSGVGDAFSKYGAGLEVSQPSGGKLPSADYNWWQNVHRGNLNPKTGMYGSI